MLSDNEKKLNHIKNWHDTSNHIPDSISRFMMRHIILWKLADLDFIVIFILSA